KSDHRPLLVHPFGLCKQNWESGRDVCSSLQVLSTKCKDWNKSTFGNIFEHKKTLQKRLLHLESISAAFPSDASRKREEETRLELEKTLWQEEVLWMMKSRIQWTREGDRNTRFFHLSALRRREFNRVKGLKRDNGQWVFEEDQLKSLAINFFKDLFTSGQPTSLADGIGMFPNPLTEAAKHHLESIPSAAEIAGAIKAMGGLKAPGKDGFHPVFFQSCWSTVGMDVSNFVSDCFRDRTLIAKANETIIVLIPKTSKPEHISQFRPISLCNVTYKAVSKCIADRLKKFMSSLTDDTRTSFATAEACQHSIRNGKSTLFWQHRWLDSGTKLIEWATRPLDDRELEMSVAEATTEPGVWNWEFLRDRLPPSCLEQIAGMDAPIVCNEEDGMIWGPDSRGRFSIASAYEITTATNYDSAANLWKCVWKWQGPNRIKHFLWLVAHNRLLTNSERNRRHMTTEDCCRLCPNSTEDSLHVLRDCRSARDFWVNFAPVSKDASFFTGTIQEWLPKYIGDADFGLQFGIALWLIWKTRNEDIFEGKKVTSDQLRLRVHSWIAGVRETMKASSFLLSGIDDRRRETLISWIPAPDDWVTVNTDGSVLQPQSLAAGGGIVRDSHGNKIAAFSANFGRCSIMRAELRAAALGLEVAWNSGCRKVNIQVDSTAAINAIQGDPNSSGRHCQVLQRIRNLCDRDWTTAVTHTFREGNRVADLLAHHGHSLAYGCHILANCNPDIRFALFSDCIGASTPRMILL
ncbi:Putative ribonuclease H protein At1g65750, partial [Linum perenne]